MNTTVVNKKIQLLYFLILIWNYESLDMENLESVMKRTFEVIALQNKSCNSVSCYILSIFFSTEYTLLFAFLISLPI